MGWRCPSPTFWSATDRAGGVVYAPPSSPSPCSGSPASSTLRRALITCLGGLVQKEAFNRSTSAPDVVKEIFSAPHDPAEGGHPRENQEALTVMQNQGISSSPGQGADCRLQDIAEKAMQKESSHKYRQNQEAFFLAEGLRGGQK